MDETQQLNVNGSNPALVINSHLSSPSIAKDGTYSTSLNSVSDGEKSFWRRQVSRLPGNIRSTSGNSGISGDSLMSKMVVGAQHSFTAPLRSLLSPLATPTDSTKHGGRRKSHARSRDDFVNATKDAWGDLDEHNDSNESLDVSNVQNLTSTPSVEKEEEKHIKDPSKHTLPIENEDDSIVIVEKDDSFSPTTSKRMTKLITVLESGTIDLAQLKKQCWTGIPMHLRPICWQLLIGYLPCSADRRSHVLAKKRKEYMDTVHQYWSNGPTEKSIAHQIHIDILRTFPLPIYSNERVQRSLECILYCWAMQHPACGYVQGINDLLTPFFTVYLGPILNDKKEIDSIPQEDLSNVEADSFWCLTKLIDGIQDNYTTAQPGIQKLVSRLREVIQRVSPKLYEHFKKENVEYIQFAFRWMNCLLMREVSHHLTIRMWDTYLAEGADFSEYHLFTCVAFLMYWEKQLMGLGFSDILLFLQNPPTKDWTDKDVEFILAQGFVYKNLFEASNHISK